MIRDKNGDEIREGFIVKFQRPVWDLNGNYVIKEVHEVVQRLESGELYANNQEEDCFFVPFSEMEIINC